MEPRLIETCVIIGHGMSPLHKGWGQEIDKHIVVRMKDPSWQEPKDYGWRLDYMCSSTETMQAMLDDMRKPKAYWCQPKKGRWDTKVVERFNARAKGVPLVIQEAIFLKWNDVFKRIQHELGNEEIRNHSLGMFAITCVAEILKPAKILLVGFDNLLNPMLLEYCKANRGKWTSNHDWMSERMMIPVIEKELGVKIDAFAA